MIKTQIIENYLNYGKVISISNSVIEAFVTVDVGPRIIRFGLVGGQNIMCDDSSVAEPKNDDVFQNYFGKDKQWEILGGHRIWISPEKYPETYYPDLLPVKYEITGCGAVFTPNAETENGLQKQLEIKMDPDDANMQVVMNVTNVSRVTKEFSVWGVTASAKNGTLVIPMNDNDTGFLHNRNISVWSYTNLADCRLHFGNRYITLRQDPSINDPFKLGLDLKKENVYYCLGDDIFRKSFATESGAKYPDNNCSFETYTNSGFLEIESLSPLKSVQPDDTLSLTEHWSILKKPCDVEWNNDKSIDEMIGKL